MDRFDWACFVFLAIILIGAIVGISMIGHQKDDRELVCIGAGYERADRIAGEFYCIGVRDGNSIVTPYLDVLEAN